MKFDKLYKAILENFRSDKLYHATYKPLLNDIFKYGLGGNPDQIKKNWNESESVVYLAIDPDVAESYAESSPDVDEDWLDEIVILEIDADTLDKNLLHIDRNVLDNEGDTWEYAGVIKPEQIKIYR